MGIDCRSTNQMANSTHELYLPKVDLCCCKNLKQNRCMDPAIQKMEKELNGDIWSEKLMGFDHSSSISHERTEQGDLDKKRA